jgi:ribonuclease G
LPLPWFRRQKHEKAQPAAEEPPAAEVTTPSSSQPSADLAEGGAANQRRRRGSRGGRNRRKTPGTATATAAVAPKPARAAQTRTTPATKEPADRQRRSATRRRQPPRRAPLPAAKRELLVSVDVTEQRVAVLEDGRVAEVYLERPERRSIAGNIYKGVVDNVLPGMEAAFVEIGLEKNGFLFVDEIVGPELEGRRPRGRRITDLISRGEEVLVQAVKDPMKTKGARLTTEISLPGRFVVYVPSGEGLGVSRRLEEDERNRLRDIVKGIAPKQGGVIVRTAAEGASAEDVQLDIDFLTKLWKQIQARAKESKAPTLLFQEAELPLRVTRDLFTGDFEKALVDDDLTLKRIQGYLKKTSPHMAERVSRYREKLPLFEAFGVDAEIRSTLSRRVDLPSGGYLIFDYAEAFTVIDVNTGRFVGSRSKTSGARLEDTVTKNNLEAVKEVVRQLRLRDIGGIIVIDFIDMANPKNRTAVEEALRTELERDRTKTYVVEISPLGLVEMTRQNVTDGPREIMTRKCPTCGGDGIVYSEASAAIDVERRLRSLATGSKSQAFRVEVAAPIASALVGPGARRLVELETLTKRRFFFEGKPAMHSDHFVVLAEGKLADLAPKAPVEEGAELTIELVEVDRHDAGAAVGKFDGLDVCVGDAAELVGKKVKVTIERVLDGTAYATLVRRTKQAPEPLTAEAEAEKPTRKPPARKTAAGGGAEIEAAETAEVDDVDADDDAEDDAEELEADEVELEVAAPEADGDEPADGETAAPATPAKKKTRRGSRGGKNRKRPATGAAAANGAPPVEAGAEPEADAELEPVAEPEPMVKPASRGVTIHVPSDEFGRDPGDEDDTAAEPAAGETPAGDGAAPAKKKTRRGSRGGKNRRKKPAGTATPSVNGDEPEAQPVEAPPEAEARSEDEDWGYVPMSEWGDEFK